MTDKSTYESIIDVQPLEPADSGQPPARLPFSGGEGSEYPRAGHWVFSAGLVTALLWAGGATAFLFGYHGPGNMANMSAAELGALGFVVSGPALLLLVVGGAARELVRFAATARQIEASARRLSAPVETAERETRALADAVAEQIERLNHSAEGSLARLGAMEEVLRHHSAAVNAASGDARREVDGLIEDLRKERSAIQSLASGLNDEARKIGASIDKQTEMVTAAIEKADTQTRAGREMLEASAERLAAASTAAHDSGERAAFSIGEQMRDMEALVGTLDERANRLEAVARSHQENLKVAQNTAHELSLAADAGAGAMRSSVDTALEQARRLAEVIAEETRAAADQGAQEIERVRRAAQAAKETAERASHTLEENASSVLERLERVNEANVAAAARSDEALESRIRSVERVVAEVDSRLSELPRRAETKAQEVREAFETSLRELDERFERERPRPPRREEREPQREPRGRGRDGGRRRREVERDDDFDQLGPLREDRGRGRDERRAPPPERDRAPRRERGGRPEEGDDEFMRRLSSGEDLFSGRAKRSDRRDRGGIESFGDTAPRRERDWPEPRGEERGGRDEEDGWRWKDVLDGIEETPRAAAAAEAIVAGLRRSGVDPALALDPDTVARVGRVRRRAGAGEARALVIDSALADVRRTAAALASDAQLRDQAEDFLDDHARKVRRAIDENDAATLSGLLDTDLGRAYLLIDAALSDI